MICYVRSMNDANWAAHAKLQAAARWERPSAQMGKHVTDALVDFANPQPGERVLDLACGTGAPSLKVARRVGSSGHVIATDLSEEPLKIAAERARERGLENIQFRLADAHALPFAEGEFDLVTCRFGVMFFADLPRALSEVRRVLKPGGRVAFAAWGSFDQPYFQSTVGVILRRTGAEVPPGAAAMFKFGEEGTLTQALHDAGFADPHDEIRRVPWVWTETAEELWAYFRAVTVPFRPVLEQATPDIETEILAELRRLWDGQKVNLTAEIVLAGGKKP
ncbi:MAG: class I SAM-dependent methyltransferase [Terriglobales bacterium]